MKKIFCVLAVAIVMVAFASCGPKSAGKKAAKANCECIQAGGDADNEKCKQADELATKYAEKYGNNVAKTDKYNAAYDKVAKECGEKK